MSRVWRRVRLVLGSIAAPDALITPQAWEDHRPATAALQQDMIEIAHRVVAAKLSVANSPVEKLLEWADTRPG
jgi:hypothetical protein